MFIGRLPQPLMYLDPCVWYLAVVRSLTVITEANTAWDLSCSFRDSGRDLLLFIHGLGCSRKAFAAAWAQDSLANFSLLSIDLLGFGDSPKPPEFPYTMESHGLLVAQIIQQFPAYRLHFVGNSMGPMIGLSMPSDIVASLASFTNIEARLCREDCGVSSEVESLSFQEFSTQFWPAFIAKIRNQSQTAYDPENALPEAFYRGAKSVLQLASSGWALKRFLELSVPKMYVYGDDRKSANMRVLPHLQGKVPLKQISCSGHFLMLDNPQEFYGSLAEFARSAIK